MKLLRILQKCSLIIALCATSLSAQDSVAPSPFQFQWRVEAPGEVAAMTSLGDKLLIGTSDGKVQIMDRASGKVSTTSASTKSGTVKAVAAAGGSLWAMTDGRSISIRSGADPSRVQEIEFAAVDIAFSPDGTQLIAASAEKEVAAWSLSNLKEKLRTARYDDKRRCVDAILSEDGARVVFVMADG